MPAISAVSERDQSKSDFIGQVLVKGSPILTWRPTKVQRITPAPVVEAPEGSESSIRLSFSRATTRRMVSWPVVPHVQPAPGRALGAFATLVAFSLLCGSALTLCVYLLLGESSVAAGRASVPARVAVTHVARTNRNLDTLAPPAPLPDPPTTTASAPPRTAARPQQRARAPHKHPASLHAARSAHHAGGANHGAT